MCDQSTFTNGGWWHDNRILAATGEGIEKEEPRAWEGWWNEKIVQLAELTHKQPGALCVLLTGRSEDNFGDLVKRMVASRGLEFDMVSLKPRVSPTNIQFQSTMHFKQLFLDALMETYKRASQIKIYEDRPKHTKGFREFFAEYNRRQHESPTRGPITADVVQVPDCSTVLDPVVEVAEVQHMINYHNSQAAKDASRKKLRIKKTVFFTSYVIGKEDTDKLLQLANIPLKLRDQDIKYHGNNILICPRPCPQSLLERVGGMGSKMLWEVIDVGSFEDKIWAARIRPVPSTAKFHSDNPIPLVVLAVRKGARPANAGKIHDWTPLPPDQTFVFETVVGEKVILRVEREDPREDEYESLFANKSAKRKHTGDDDSTSKAAQRGGHGSRGNHPSSSRGGRGRGGGGPRGGRGGRGGSRGGRGRGGSFIYRSLDDVEPKNQMGGQNAQVDYDDAYPPLGGQPSGGKGPRGKGSSKQGGQGRPMRGGQAGGGGQDLQNFY